MADEIPKRCPKCGGSPVAEILYGLYAPVPEIDEKIAAGLITIGGCSVDEDSPRWRCSNCGASGGTPEL